MSKKIAKRLVIINSRMFPTAYGKKGWYMKICFVLPELPRRPVGGYLVVFQYANRLLSRGHEILIVFACKETYRRIIKIESIRKVIISALVPIMPRWFKLDKRIRKYTLLDKNVLNKIGTVDACFATGIATVKDVKQFFFGSCKCFYLIQDFENWSYSNEYVYATYSCGMQNIVVSNWIKKIVDEHSNRKSYIISNPIDTEVYRCVISPELRDKFTISACYNTNPIKGGMDLLNALNLVQKEIPQLQVHLFGRAKKPGNLPEWIQYKENASTEQTVEIYNRSSVFVCASISEGFGLPGLEAMACGACLVSTSYEGVLEYCENMKNCLLSPIKNPECLALNVIRVIKDEELRMKLINNGIEMAKKRSWDDATNKLDFILTSEIKTKEGTSLKMQ